MKLFEGNYAYFSGCPKHCDSFSLTNFFLFFFIFYAHYFVSGKCHVVHSETVCVEASTHQTTTRKGGVRERQMTLSPPG